jgi:hypothetical protein
MWVKSKSEPSTNSPKTPGDPSSGGWHRIPRSERFQNFSWEGEEGRRAVNGHWGRKGVKKRGELMGTSSIKQCNLTLKQGSLVMKQGEIHHQL